MPIGPTMSRVLASFCEKGTGGAGLTLVGGPWRAPKKWLRFIFFDLASLENTSTHNSRTDAKNTRQYGIASSISPLCLQSRNGNQLCFVFLGAVRRALDCGPVEGIQKWLRF